MANTARNNRHAVDKNNPHRVLEQQMSRLIVASLDGWRDWRDRFSEWLFLSVYGAPWLQAAVGIDPAETRPLRKAAKDPMHRDLVQARITELKSRIGTGGLQECVVRAVIYAGAPRGALDERGIEAVRGLRLAAELGLSRPSLAEFKALVREQFFMLLLDTEAALEAIPGMLPADADVRRKAVAAISQVLSARAEIAGEVADRMQRVARLFGVEPTALSGEKVAVLRAGGAPKRKAS